MAAAFISPLYILLIIYLILKSLRFFKTILPVCGKKWFKLIYCILVSLFAASPVIAFFLPDGGMQRIWKSAGNFCLGFLLYVILAVLVQDIVTLILIKAKILSKEQISSKKAAAAAGTAVFAFIIAMCTYGLINSHIIKVNNYEVSVNKKAGNLKELNIVLIADLHLGYNADCALMEQMVKKINAQNPDIVLCAGDFFDNEYEALDNPEKLEEILSGIRSKYGSYTVFGNHDIEEPILGGFTFPSRSAKVTDPRFIEFVQKSGMKILSDETVLIDNSFYIVGRRDREEPGNETKTRLSPSELLHGLDSSRPLIDLEHEPANLEAVSAAGYDLDLCGHTHAGQVFPGTVLIHFFWENAWGYKRIGNMQNIVTSGVGSFGPYMRTMCDSEICRIHVTFEG